jgi:hypothetical protein
MDAIDHNNHERKRLRAERDLLRGLLAVALPAIDPAAAGHSVPLGTRGDCPCVLCRVAQAVRYSQSTNGGGRSHAV